MSRLATGSFNCACGRAFSAPVYRSANVTLDPGLMESITAGRFNVVACPACGIERAAEVPFLYHDMARELAIWVYPEAEVARAGEIRARLRKVARILASSVGEGLAEESGTRLVFGLDALRDEISRQA